MTRARIHTYPPIYVRRCGVLNATELGFHSFLVYIIFIFILFYFISSWPNRGRYAEVVVGGLTHGLLCGSSNFILSRVKFLDVGARRGAVEEILGHQAAGGGAVLDAPARMAAGHPQARHDGPAD